MDIGSIISINTLIRLMLGLGIGFAIGMTGIGAGVLVIPSLIYIVGLSPVSAVGTGFVYSTLTRAYGVFEHLKLRTIRKRTAFYIILGGVPAVIATSLVITYLARTIGSGLDSVLKIIIIVVMIITWVLMLVNLFRNRKAGSENYYVPPKHFPYQRKIYGIAAGAGVGILIGSTSMGGGVLIVPILVSIFRLSPSNTVGTSVLIGITMSTVGSLAYLLGGGVDLTVAVTMFLGSIPGVYLGSRISVKVPHRTLSFILFAVVTTGVVAMLVGIMS